MDAFEADLAALRPRLHRYCARMTGSAISGEDVVQDAIVKALQARANGAVVDHAEAWLFRIAHHTCLDFLRSRARHKVVALSEDMVAAAMPEAEMVMVSFRAFLRLPELQRCAVILKDVLGHSIDEIAAIADCSAPAAKSALQRGRAALRQWALEPEDMRLPLLAEADRQKIAAFVGLFQSGDFDAIRVLLADDVRLELVNRLRLDGRAAIAPYFTRYAEVTTWRFVLGAVEGQPAMLVYDSRGAMEKPAHFVMVGWSAGRIISIRDFLFAPYVLDAADWLRLE